MSPAQWVQRYPGGWADLKPIPCTRAGCPLVAGCDRAASKGGLAVKCPVLGGTRVALAPFVPVRRGKRASGAEVQ
ncbi:hypothetical protein [Falsiroseomonas sp. E2-1-a20]|uniref:hypothetical protein n=1 Tax=Falsiroseomonas sp. E2-1-a20 TaxID=3239300 RepID=UPI003F2A8183